MAARQLARLALIVAAVGRCSRPAGTHSRADAAVAREGLRAAGGARGAAFPQRPTGDRRELRRVSVSASRARRLTRSAESQVRRAPRALENVEKLLTAP